MLKTEKCPNCASELRFDADSGICFCDKCGTSYNISDISVNTVNDIKKSENELHETKVLIHSPKTHRNSTSSSKDDEKTTENIEPTMNFSAIKNTCASCGAEILTDSRTLIDYCVYCGSQNFVSDKVDNIYKPSALIRFYFDEDGAIQSFLEWARTRNDALIGFWNKNNIKRLRGFFIPYWLYDVDCEMDLDAIVSSREVESDEYEVTTYQNLYKSNMKRNIRWRNIEYYASRKFPRSFFKSIDYYDFDLLIPFNEKYLKGFYADCYDEPEKSFTEQIRRDLKQSVISTYEAEAKNIFRGFQTCSVKENRTKVKKFVAKYVLLPVWILEYEYDGEIYTFAINGQTGDVVGDYPEGKLRRFIKAALFFALASFVLFGIICF